MKKNYIIFFAVIILIISFSVWQIYAIPSFDEDLSSDTRVHLSTNKISEKFEKMHYSPTQPKEGITSNSLTISNASEAKSLRKYSRISWLTINDVDFKDLGDIQGIQIRALYLNNVNDFDFSKIDTSMLKILSITDSTFANSSALSNATHLDEMYLSKLDADCREILSGKNNLEHLTISQCSLGDYSPISSMSELVSLYISSSDATDINFVSNCKKLTTLEISNCSAKRISDISQLTNLNYLGLFNNSISGTLNLSGQKNLANLNISHNIINEVIFNPGINPSYMDLSYNAIDRLTPDMLKVINLSDSPVNIFGNVLNDYENIQNNSNIKYVNQHNIELSFAQFEQYNNQLNSFISTYIDHTWDDTTKAMMSFVMLSKTMKYHYEYDTQPDSDITKYSHTEYGALCNKIAVCDGFSYAYRDILKKLGIKSDIYHGDLGSTTDRMRHAWNVVKLDSGTYHCDLTNGVSYGGIPEYFDNIEDYINAILKKFGCSDNDLLISSYTLDDKRYEPCTKNIGQDIKDKFIKYISNSNYRKYIRID